MQEDTSKFFRGTRQMENINWEQMAKYLVESGMN